MIKNVSITSMPADKAVNITTYIYTSEPTSELIPIVPTPIEHKDHILVGQTEYNADLQLHL